MRCAPSAYQHVTAAGELVDPFGGIHGDRALIGYQAIEQPGLTLQETMDPLAVCVQPFSDLLLEHPMACQVQAGLLGHVRGNFLAMRTGLVRNCNDPHLEILHRAERSFRGGPRSTCRQECINAPFCPRLLRMSGCTPSSCRSAGRRTGTRDTRMLRSTPGRAPCFAQSRWPRVSSAVPCPSLRPPAPPPRWLPSWSKHAPDARTGGA